MGDVDLERADGGTLIGTVNWFMHASSWTSPSSPAPPPRVTHHARRHPRRVREGGYLSPSLSSYPIPI
jgi:hypothetical protein